MALHGVGQGLGEGLGQAFAKITFHGCDALCCFVL